MFSYDLSLVHLQAWFGGRVADYTLKESITGIHRPDGSPSIPLDTHVQCRYHLALGIHLILSSVVEFPSLGQNFQLTSTDTSYCKARGVAEMELLHGVSNLEVLQPRASYRMIS